MSRESIDIVDQNKFERFNRTASLGPELVDFAHSSLPRHSVTRKQHCGRRQAGSQTTSGGRTDRILPAHPGRDIWLRNPNGDVILPRTDSHFNDTGLDFGDNPSCLVNFHLPLRVWVCQADGAQIILPRTVPGQTPRDLSIFLPSGLGPSYSQNFAPL